MSDKQHVVSLCSVVSDNSLVVRSAAIYHNLILIDQYFKLTHHVFLSINQHGNPLPGRLSCLHFHPLEVVCRCRDTQLQVGENYSFLYNLRPNIRKS